MKKLMFIFGTRPEFIKVYPIIEEAKKNKNFDLKIVNTGQHKEMLDELLVKFNIQPDYNLEIMDKSNGLTDILVNSLVGLDKIIKNEKPDMILVHGDTSATLAGSIQAFYNQVPLAHIEAGLRTYNKFSPFPEEVNRQITGVIADLHFTPTKETEKYLLNEGKSQDSIFVVGNSAIDTLKYTIEDDFQHEVLEWANNNKLILITAHRRENLDSMKDMFKAINDLAKEYKDYKFVYPVHLNPLIQGISKEFLTNDNIKLINPLNPVEFHNIMKRSYLILTDSGGIQEEAPSLGKPVLVLRDTTERPEGVEAGTLKLIGTNGENIVKEVKMLLDNKDEYEKMSGKKNPYGDGTTSKKIIKIINEYFENRRNNG